MEKYHITEFKSRIVKGLATGLACLTLTGCAYLKESCKGATEGEILQKEKKLRQESRWYRENEFRLKENRRLGRTSYEDVSGPLF